MSKLFVITQPRLTTVTRLTEAVTGNDVPALRAMLDAGNVDGWDILMLAMCLRYGEVRRVYVASPVIGLLTDREAVTAELERLEAARAVAVAK